MDRTPGPVRLIVASLVALTIIFSGCSVQNNSTELREKQIAEITEALDRIHDHYVEPSTLQEINIAEAAINGLIDEMDDPYTSYLTADQYRVFFDFTGEFQGIGAEVGIRDGQVVIHALLPESPAEKSGLRPGDIITMVDDSSIATLTLLQAVGLIRGPKGTPVVLTILRTNTPDPFEVTIIRDVIKTTSVRSEVIDGNVGYVRISGFHEPTSDELRSAITRLKEQGSDSLILDLRNNGGGLLDTAVEVVSQFIDEGVALISVDGSGEKTEFRVSGDGEYVNLPLVVLSNEFSASASEIVIGALQDHKRATVIGTRTFGKGSVTITVPLESGSGLSITMARWLTPNGRMIEGEGLVPDITVGAEPQSQETREILTLAHSLCYRLEEDIDLIKLPDNVLHAMSELCTLDRAEEPGQPNLLEDDPHVKAAIRLLREK